jgi:hypothetical protein
MKFYKSSISDRQSAIEFVRIVISGIFYRQAVIESGRFYS